MRTIVAIFAALLLLFSTLAVSAFNGYEGPAPNSGDGISDGSGFDGEAEPNGVGDPLGPAPNSGDGIPDGSGFDDGDVPHGPA